MGRVKTLIFTATYNEVENIDIWYNQVRKFDKKSQILIIDDSSIDGTNLKIKLLQKKDNNLKLITRMDKSGLGTAHLTAFKYAIKNNFDYLITMDADLSHEPKEIGKLLKKLETSDFVIGTRFNGGTTEYKFLRKYLSVFANVLCRIIIPSQLTEYTTSYRGFNNRSLSLLIKKQKWSDNYAFFIEVVDFLHISGLKLEEVPINFLKRRNGNTKIPNNQILKTLIVLMKLAVSRKLSKIFSN
jgi:dolichol-phosphate mannosyltransferase